MNGSINCTKYGGGRGGFSISGVLGVGGDITVTGSIEGDAGLTAPTGNIYVGGAITADVVIELSVGDPNPFADCGGSIAEWKSKRRGFLTAGCTIEAPALSAKQHIWAFATGNISLGDVTLADDDTGEFSPAGHDVRIYANMGELSPATFALGAGGTNGCTSISNTGATTQSNNGGVVYIYNPGGIDVTVSALDIVKNVDGVPGLVLSADDAEITLDGDLNVDGDSSTPAGYIALLAGKLTLAGATTLSASDTMASPEPSSPVIAIAASDIPVAGNIVIQCNGYTDTFVGVGPTGSLNLPLCPYFSARPGQLDPVGGETKFEGSGNLQISANSSGGSVYLLGTPLTLNAGTVDITALGEGTSIDIAYDDSPAGVNSFISTGGALTLDAHDPASGAGNFIAISADGISVTSAFDVKADALGSGNGGSVSLIASGDVAFDTATGTCNMSANGAGSGSGGIVSVQSGGILDLTTLSVNANGGATGDGGSVNLSYASDTTLTVKDLSATGFGAGGNVAVNNTGSFDLAMSVIGNLDTSTDGGDTLAGTTTLTVSDDQTYAVLMDIDGAGAFNSVLSSVAASISVLSLADVTLGVGNLESTTGNISLCVDGTGICGAAVATKPSRLLASNSKVIVVPAGSATAETAFEATVPTFVNNGGIIGRDSTAIFATHVTNNGTISSQNGPVQIVSKDFGDGEDLLLDGNDSHIISQANALPGAITIEAHHGVEPATLTIAGSHTFSAEGTQSGVRLGASTDPIGNPNTDPSSIILPAGAQVSVEAELLEAYSPTISIASTAQLLATQAVATIAFFDLSNAGQLHFGDLICYNPTLAVYGGGSIVSDGELNLVFIQNGNAIIADSVNLGPQTLSGESVRILANTLSISSNTQVQGADNVFLNFVDATNDGLINVTHSGGGIHFGDGSFGSGRTFSGDGSLQADTIEIQLSRPTVIEQDEISGTITGITTGNLSITTDSGALTLGAITANGGSLSLVTAGSTLEVLTASLIANLGSLLLQNSSGGTVTIASSAALSSNVVGGGTVTIVSGAIPASWTTITGQTGVTLANAAVNGVNVFFGTGISAAGSNTIDLTTSSSQAQFNDGTNISLAGGVTISA